MQTRTSETAELPVRALWLMKNWTAAAGIVSGFTLILSVTYDWSYFSTFDVGSIQYLSLADHISAAFEWLPATLITYLVGTGVALLHSKLFPNRPTADEDRFHDVLGRWGPKKKFAVIMSPLLAYFAVSVIVGERWQYLSLLAFFLISIIYVVGFIADRGWSKADALVIIAFLALFSLARTNGNMAATTAFTANTGSASLTLTGGEAVHGLVLLRRLEKGVLVRNISDNAVQFFPWDAVRRVDVPRYPLREGWGFCVWFPTTCAGSGNEAFPKPVGQQWGFTG